jgi:predicted thioesterase
MDPTEKLRPGMTGTHSLVVTREVTVAHFHPEMPEVFGTPFLVYLMEVASADAIRQGLPVGWVSVGYEVNVRHTAPTPVGRTVTARAVLESVDGRLITFSVEAHDGVAQVGSGKHTRGLVDLARFGQKLRSQ